MNIKKKEIGLALGSGAARGFAHISIIKEIEKNYEIKAISGTSAGAIIGAYYALHGEIDSFMNKIKKMKKSDFLKLIDPNTKRISFIKGKKIYEHMIKEWYKNAEFKDTKIPLIICATNIETKKPTYITSGKIADAVLASSSLPGLFPPQKINKQFHVDGGLSDPVPAEILLEKKLVKKVVAINLNNYHNKFHEPKTTTEILLTSFYLMMEKIAKKKENKNIFVLNPSFIRSPGSALKVYNYKKPYIEGLKTFQKNKKKLLEWY